MYYIYIYIYIYTYIYVLYSLRDTPPADRFCQILLCWGCPSVQISGKASGFLLIECVSKLVQGFAVFVDRVRVQINRKASDFLLIERCAN